MGKRGADATLRDFAIFLREQPGNDDSFYPLGTELGEAEQALRKILVLGHNAKPLLHKPVNAYGLWG